MQSTLNALTDDQKKWLAALHSGEYEQGQGYLRAASANEDGTCDFCCLGVAAMVLGDEQRWHGRDSGVYRFDEETSYLPQSFATDRLGLNREDQVFIAEMNDEYELTFPQIADAVRYRLMHGEWEVALVKRLKNQGCEDEESEGECDPTDGYDPEGEPI